MSGRFVTDAHVSDFSRQANNFARRFNQMAEAAGFDLPMEVLIPLIELFGEAMRLGGDAPARLLELATARARRQHGYLDSHERWVAYEGHAGEPSQCQHPDCRVVRQHGSGAGDPVALRALMRKWREDATREHERGSGLDQARESQSYCYGAEHAYDQCAAELEAIVRTGG